jgi:hypothetical protein
MKMHLSIPSVRRRRPVRAAAALLVLSAAVAALVVPLVRGQTLPYPCPCPPCPFPVPNAPCPVAATGGTEIDFTPQWLQGPIGPAAGYWYYVWQWQLSITCGQGTDRAFCEDCTIVQVEQCQPDGTWLGVATTGANASPTDTICNLTARTNYWEGWGQMTDPTGATNPAPGSLYRFAAYISPMAMGDWPGCDGFTTAGRPTLAHNFTLLPNRISPFIGEYS